MSPSGRAEGMARLRRVIAQIEAEAGPAGERPARRLPFARSFDSTLGGGLADDALHESRPLSRRTERRRWALRWRWPGGF
jgi:hypothetical protein